METADAPDDYDYAYWEARKHKRYKAILDLRAQGMSYYEVGKRVGVSANYAAVLHKRAIPDFYRRLTTPLRIRPEQHPPTISWMDLYTLYPLKDFLTELADDNQDSRVVVLVDQDV